ncbi:MAG: NAD(P)H-binding protein [Ramlibacter sp.]|uniref:NAD(P)H-binding protein n=1 Tax=Ramlibacter sp. TaxID=1917967 RepID=UPI002611B8D9|nr:NAD(P)H-binding protein [Ramlibacter sp.]MDH4378231.1 NAD(P)H-binding protein [Ramlibacter sp.]
MTGATGFIGGALARALLAQGHELVCAVREPARLQLPGDGWSALACDLAAVPGDAFWQPHLAGIDAVINAVGILREARGQTFEALHARAPIALFEAAARAGVPTVLQVSALGADEGAESRYHRSKKQADDCLRSLPVAGAVVQPSAVYGPGSDAAAMFNFMSALPLLAMPQAGRMLMQPVHVEDVVAGLLALLAAPPKPVATVAFVGPRALTMAGYLRELRVARGNRWPLPVLWMPTFAFMTAARVAGLIPGSVLDAETAGMLLRGNAAPVDDFQRLLGRAPRSVAEFLLPPVPAASQSSASPVP